jgi:rubrerythrin
LFPFLNKKGNFNPHSAHQLQLQLKNQQQQIAAAAAAAAAAASVGSTVSSSTNHLKRKRESKNSDNNRRSPSIVDDYEMSNSDLIRGTDSLSPISVQHSSQLSPQSLLNQCNNANGATGNSSGTNNNGTATDIWRCPYCCYETTSASRYNSHLVCHGWKPYLCPHCGSRSNRLPDMRTHISTFHPEFNVNTFVVLSEEEAKSTLKDYMKNRALINRKLKEMRPQPKFKCNMCAYASLYQFNLTKHVKSVHLSDIYNKHKQHHQQQQQSQNDLNSTPSY